MKAKRFDVVVMAVLLFVLSAFVVQNGGTIKGKVIPAENAFRVFAIMGSDTTRQVIHDGNFELTKLKQGSYELWIEATDPYQHKHLTDVQVKENQVTDVGDIQLMVK